MNFHLTKQTLAVTFCIFENTVLPCCLSLCTHFLGRNLDENPLKTLVIRLFNSLRSRIDKWTYCRRYMPCEKLPFWHQDLTHRYLSQRHPKSPIKKHQFQHQPKPITRRDGHTMKKGMKKNPMDLKEYISIIILIFILINK